MYSIMRSTRSEYTLFAYWYWCSFVVHKSILFQKNVHVKQSFFYSHIHNFFVTYLQSFIIHHGSGSRSRYSDTLRTGQFGDRVQMGVRFSSPVQTGLRAHPSSYKQAIVSFSGPETVWVRR